MVKMTTYLHKDSLHKYIQQNNQMLINSHNTLFFQLRNKTLSWILNQSKCIAIQFFGRKSFVLDESNFLFRNEKGNFVYI
jgi:hypothetical protein